MKKNCFIAIDLKSFYASVECVERGLDPLTTNLVVADESRTEKTICLAATPAIKSYGVPGRARLFEVIQKVKAANSMRRFYAPGRKLTGTSHDATELANNPNLAIDYIVAPPRMAFYMDYSARIYKVYLRYIAPQDIHTYSIDEVFINAAPYLDTYKMTAHDLAMKLVRKVLKETGITATAGIGTNLYLAKIAMDIVAKHIPPDPDGVRIAALDEMSYRRKLWAHTPLTDFWRVGKGYAEKGGIGIGDSIDYVKSIYGEPTSVGQRGKNYLYDGLYAYDMTYGDSFKISVVENSNGTEEVIDIASTANNGLAMPCGIKVGSSIGEVYKNFGMPWRINSAKSIERNYVYRTQYSPKVVFTTNQQHTITRITIIGME